MKIFRCDQVAAIDRFTIEHEPISELDLMERAASGISQWIEENQSRHRRLMVFAGPGNNGGDGLVIARQMAAKGYSVEVWLPDSGRQLSLSCLANLERLKEQAIVPISFMKEDSDFPEILGSDIVIDALFGSGLSRPVEGMYASLIQYLNASHATIIAVDIPSGLFGENNSENDSTAIVQATITLTFHFPKLSFMFAENEKYVGKWKIIPIGLHPEIIRNTETPYYFTTKDVVLPILHERSKFGHKGLYGHALLIAGSYGKMGAAVLSARACLRSGVGLLTTHIPQAGYEIIQQAVPESMVSIDRDLHHFTYIPDLKKYNSIAIGPGLGTNSHSVDAMAELLRRWPNPMIIDADGINLLSQSENLLELLPPDSIITPHPGEFMRLAGKSSNSFEMLEKQKRIAQFFKIYVVLKGAHTCVAFPDGRCYFNTTGNPGMATAGSGDVLTGIILGLLARGYTSAEACVLGVYIHGLAGDYAAKKNGYESLIAGDITEYLGKAFLTLKNGCLTNNDYF
ncbi:MAG: NAD(P)H-hydrate dehydratase [Bacteroidota bacterium]|nr:NAD(P)H-hydrate dehydratase [Bacteroidota bacterium]MDP4204825.1 NAD(P)H-hydrate dehydratase [Bacteroidota bacterium]